MHQILNMPGSALVTCCI